MQPVKKKKALITFTGRFICIFMIDCRWCKNKFKPSRKDQVYCRKKCRDYASAKRTGLNSRRCWRQRGINITLEEYENLLKIQDSKCKICQRNKNDLSVALAVDHDHKTGKIRGLLCSSCNQGLGLFLDSPLLLKNAINYLN